MRLAAWIALGLVLLLLVALALGLLARRALARETLVTWLQSQGIEADARFERLGARGLVAGLRIGPAEAPIVQAERAEVDYRLKWPWNGEGFGVEVRRLRLLRPEIRAAVTPEGISLGDLDPLIADFRARPAQPDAPAPEIVVEGGVLRLSHAAGEAVLHMDARMAQGVLTDLSGRMEAARLATDAYDLDIAEARLGLATREGRSAAVFIAALDRARFGEVEAEAATLNLTADAAYPDLQARAGDGPVALAVRLEAGKLSQGEAYAGEGVRLQGGFRGQAAGALPELRLTGEGALTLTASGFSAGAANGGETTASLEAADLVWSRAGEGALAAKVKASFDGRDIRSGDLALRRAAGALAGEAAMADGAWRAVLQGPLSAAGAYRGLGAPAPGEAPALAAIKQAAGDFTLASEATRIAYGENGLTVGLDRPARLHGRNGLQATFSPIGGAPVFRDGRGALALDLKGGGAPQVQARFPDYAWRDGALEARAEVAARTDFAPLEGVETQARGRLRFSDGALAFTAEACAPLSIARFEAGANSVEAISGQVCPTDAPLVQVAGGRWRLTGRAQGMAAQIPFLEAALADGGGNVRFGGGPAGLDAQAEHLTGEVRDAAEAIRFHPMTLAGTARLDGEMWRAELDLSRLGRRLAAVGLNHDVGRGAGGVVIETGQLSFAEGGLQPADISPLAEAVGSPAFGEAAFSGRFDWAGEAVSSGGRLVVSGLDFASPAGDVQGLAGAVEFESLTPLVTAPGQTLRATSVKSLTVLGDPEVVFQLSPESLLLSQGGLHVGGGQVRIEPLTIPLDPSQTWRGVLVVEGVQLSDIVEATPFGDRVDLQAKVSGRLPFTFGPGGVSIVQGKLAADEPGRLSIRRSALTQVDATGGAATAQAEGRLIEAPVAVQEAEQANAAVEFAYQAMENLAFDLLDAEVNSLPGGRLGVLLHIRGEHAPPQRQEIRLTLMELIRRDFLNRELPLPSGTKVDLTLDTSLNLDQLLRDYVKARSADSSDAVQTQPPE